MMLNLGAWQIKGPICNFVNGSGDTKKEREKINNKPKKALTVKFLMRQDRLVMRQCKM